MYRMKTRSHAFSSHPVNPIHLVKKWFDLLGLSAIPGFLPLCPGYCLPLSVFCKPGR
jgi:hypothetical protein